MRYTSKGGSKEIVVDVTKPAELLIGKNRVQEFVKALTEMMDTLGAGYAWVCRVGLHVQVSIRISDSWTGVMKGKR